VQDSRGSTFIETDLSGSQFRGVDFSNVKISDAWLVDVDISGHVAGLTINGVDVTNFVEEQLDERYPVRKLLTATAPDGMRTAWSSLEQAASETVERARRLPAALLDESVHDEWSFLQTLRHLIYATDRWITGPVLAEPDAVHSLGMPNPPYEDLPRGVFDLDARPTLDEVLIVRHGRMNAVRKYVGNVKAEQLDLEVNSPNGGKTTVRRCLQVVFKEEWWHNLYAIRDLDVLEHG
jgi:DinB superfamily/Pentapeptide repeats (8 copies)